MVLVAVAVGVFGATPGRQLRLLAVRDRYEAAIATGHVGTEAGTSDGDLAAWVWVAAPEADVSGVVFDPADSLDQHSRLPPRTVGSTQQVVDCSRLRKNWFWCDFVLVVE